MYQTNQINKMLILRHQDSTLTWNCLRLQRIVHLLRRFPPSACLYLSWWRNAAVIVAKSIIFSEKLSNSSNSTSLRIKKYI